MENQKKFYITTPIYYPSDKLHIGHTLPLPDYQQFTSRKEE